MKVKPYLCKSVVPFVKRWCLPNLSLELALRTAIEVGGGGPAAPTGGWPGWPAGVGWPPDRLDLDPPPEWGSVE